MFHSSWISSEPCDSMRSTKEFFSDSNGALVATVLLFFYFLYLIDSSFSWCFCTISLMCLQYQTLSFFIASHDSISFKYCWKSSYPQFFVSASLNLYISSCQSFLLNIILSKSISLMLLLMSSSDNYSFLDLSKWLNSMAFMVKCSSIPLELEFLFVWRLARFVYLRNGWGKAKLFPIIDFIK